MFEPFASRLFGRHQEFARPYRAVIFDVETTGLNPEQDRVVEIGCLELLDHLPTGRFFQRYVNPGKKSQGSARNVHGLSSTLLSYFPPFVDIVGSLKEFINGYPLVAHNAQFDIGFLSEELNRCRYSGISSVNVIDTLELARKYSEYGNSLEALCRERFNLKIDLLDAPHHGAMRDCILLAMIYPRLLGKKQYSLEPSFERLQFPIDRTFVPPYEKKMYQIFVPHIRLSTAVETNFAFQFASYSDPILKLDREEVIGDFESGKIMIGVLPSDITIALNKANMFNMVWPRLRKIFSASGVMVIDFQLIGPKAKRDDFLSCWP